MYDVCLCAEKKNSTHPINLIARIRLQHHRRHQPRARRRADPDRDLAKEEVLVARQRGFLPGGVDADF